jgi:hypothetical protein
VRLKPPQGSAELSAAFDAGVLPEPLALPRGTPDRQAAALAKAVFQRDEKSTAALYAAVLASGYAVRKRDGRVVRTRPGGAGRRAAFEREVGVEALPGPLIARPSCPFSGAP